METLQELWVVAETASAARELVTFARDAAQAVTLMYGGPAEEAPQATRVVVLDLAGEGVAAFAPAVGRAAADARPDAVLVQASKNCRCLAAAISAACDAAPLCDPMGLAFRDGFAVAKKMLYGGAGVKTERVALGTAVVVAGEGLFEAGELPAADAVERMAPAKSGVRLVERRPRAVANVNLAAAKRIVGVGRGLGQEENLAPVREFAQAIEAEIACTRPVSEEEKWLPKETYLGVSGKIVAPEAYFALGISGQVQHMVGVKAAGKIIAVNKDKNAPIFKQCDVGLVGDLSAVLPALTARLRK